MKKIKIATMRTYDLNQLYRENNFQLNGCRIFNNITTDLDGFEGYFHVLHCFNLHGAAALFFHLVSFGQFL